jgi:hypothetical protein
LCGEKRERKWGWRLLKCQECLAFDEEEFEWMPDMSVGYSVKIDYFTQQKVA